MSCTKGYEGYGALLQAVGETAHQSCLILTSREKPKDFIALESKTTYVQTITLNGLSGNDSRNMLRDKKLIGSDQAWSTLVRRFSGNPLALKLVAEPIRELFDSNIDTFIKEGVDIFDDIYQLLEQQFNRLSELEKEIMYWLAINRDVVSSSDLIQDIIRLSDTAKDIMYWLVIERESLSINDMMQNLTQPLSRRELLDEISSLRRRNMIEVVNTNFTLQPVVMEYMTVQLVEKMYAELTESKVRLLASHALMKAEAKDYLRASQIRILIDALAKKLMNAFRSRQTLEHHIKQLIVQLQKKPSLLPGYAAGNLINLLIHLKYPLTDYNLSHLTISQAYFAQVELHNVDMSQSDLEHSVFRETFGSIFSTAFSPDGRYLAAGTVNGEIRLWHLSDRTKSISFSDADLLWSVTDSGDDWVWSIAFHPTLPVLASGNDNHSIKIWDAEHGTCQQALYDHTSRVWCVSFSPDGTLLASASDDQTVRLWDWEQGILLHTFTDHTNRVVSVSFNPDGTLLASTSDDHTVKLWDIATQTCILSLDQTAKPVCSIFNHDGSLLAIAGEEKDIKFWNVQDGYYSASFQGHTQRVSTLAFSRDGSTIVSGSDDASLRLWDVHSGVCRHVLTGHENSIYSAAYNADGLTIASGSEDQTLKLWDVITGQCIRTLQGYTNQVWSLGFHPKGTHFASGHEDKTVKLWDTATAHCLMVLHGHATRVRSVTFNHDGSMVASGSEDGTCQ